MLTLVADADRAVGVHRCAFLAWLLLWAIYVLFAPAGILDACGAAAAPAASDILAFGHRGCAISGTGIFLNDKIFIAPLVVGN